MNRRIVRRKILWLIVGFVILGCASPVFVSSPPPLPTLGSIERVVVQTAAAAQTQTAIHIPPSSTPTNTPVATKTITITPSPTATVLLITETSLPEGSFLEEGGFEGEIAGDGSFVNDPDVTPTKVREWSCRFLSMSPVKGSEMRGGSKFKATWMVQNIGTKTWPQKGVDIVYHTGAHLHVGKPYYDIPATIGPGGKVRIEISMKAPNYPETYSTRWALQVGNRKFCAVKFIIEVK